jgi:elongation factor 1-alpha
MAATDNTNKVHLGIVIVGHVDAGKSTTTGHLLFKLGGLNERELEKLRKEARELGKESFLFAFFMDKSKDERARGVTIACTTREFYTPNFHYTIIDAPGHRDFIKNMISGASQADVALLMVPANKGGFETSIAKGNHKKGEIQGQTRQHARLCHLLGIEQLIVGVNKMDDSSVNYAEDRYNEIKGEVDKMLTKIGYKTKKIPFIPMSGFKGENLDRASDNMPWWNGFSVKIKKETVTGVTLVDALDRVVQPPKRILDKPMRMPVSGVYNIRGVGDVITGRIEQGTLAPNVTVRFYPTNVKGKAFSIEMHHTSVPQAGPGDNVGVNVKQLPKDNMPKVGDVMCIDDPALDPEPPKKAQQFTALVFVQDHPGQLKCAQPDGQGGFRGGFTPSIHIRTAKAPCQMVAINWKMGKSTSNQKVEGVPYIEAGDQAEVVFAPKMPLVVQPFDTCKPLGRIAAMDSNSLVMLGKVMDVQYAA